MEKKNWVLISHVKKNEECLKPFNFSKKQSVNHKIMVLLVLEICTGMPGLKWKSYFSWILIYVYFVSTTVYVL